MSGERFGCGALVLGVGLRIGDGVFPMEVGGVELFDFLGDFFRGEGAFPEEDLGDGAVGEVAGEVGGGGADLKDVVLLIGGGERVMLGDFFTVEKEFDFAVWGGGDDGEVLFAIVDVATAASIAHAADVVVESAVSDKEGFPSFGPFSFPGRAGGESAVIGSGGKTGEEGEGTFHREMFSRKGSEVDGVVGDERVGDFDALGGGIAGGLQVNGGGMIREVLVGEILAGGEFELEVIQENARCFFGRVAEEESSVAEGIAGSKRGVGLFGKDGGRSISLRKKRRGKQEDE